MSNSVMAGDIDYRVSTRDVSGCSLGARTRRGIGPLPPSANPFEKGLNRRKSEEARGGNAEAAGKESLNPAYAANDR